MERPAFIVISVVASMALAASCASFTEGNDAATDAGPARPDGGPVPDTSAGADAAVPDAPPDGLPLTVACVGPGAPETFDQPLADTGWNIDGAPVRATNDGFPPPSLLAEVPIFVESEAGEHAIRRDFALNGHSRVCIELDVFLEQLGGTFTQDAYAEVLEIGADNRGLFAEMRSIGFAFTDDSKPTAIVGFEFAKWQHLVMKLQFDAVALPSIQVSGGPLVTGTRPMGDVIPSDITVHLGLEAKGASGKTGAMRVHIDNFRFVSAP